jgi:HEAT repeat protein
MTTEPIGWSVGVILLQIGAVLTLAMLGAVVLERAVFAVAMVRQRRLYRRYDAVVRRALDGDDEAARVLAASPRRHRLPLAVLLVTPLIDDRDPARIARTREIVQALSLRPLVGRYLKSPWWWRRAIALRAFGLMQVRERTASIVAALDDGHPDVRAAALDALTDMQDPASLQAIVVRLHDASLHRGRRAAALTSFGHQAEPFLLDLAGIDPAHRLNYARALAICGSAKARPVLCDWTRDPNPQLRAAAFEALANIGLDADAATLAVDALDSGDPAVRAMAARALRGWTGETDAAARLAERLDDAWAVAVEAAESLRSMGAGGAAALLANATRADLAGVLARQMIWESEQARR